MAVYVDPLINYGWKLGPSCHLFADSKEELIKFGTRIKLKRSWLQKSRSGLYHFDLVESKRWDAVRAGAIQMDIATAGTKMIELIGRKNES